MNIQSIADRIVLVSLNLGCWRATKLNKRETRRERQRHGNDTLRVTLRVCEHPALEELEKLHNSVYVEHKHITLPSVMDGLRVLPMSKVEQHQNVIQDAKSEHDRLVSEFLRDYPQERINAKDRLGSLYEPQAWPDPSLMSSKFSFVCRHLRCPTDGQWAEWLQETVEVAHAELRERLVGAARHLVEVCRDGKLFQSAFDNLKEIATLVGDGFNLLDDPIVAFAAKQLAEQADKDAFVVRLDDKERKRVAQNIESILDGFTL